MTFGISLASYGLPVDAVAGRSCLDHRTATYGVAYTGNSSAIDQGAGITGDDFAFAMDRADVFVADENDRFH
jgi:hypothetical protein